jgi:predicted enzyme related to lactoylglutathione lyase
VVVAPEQKRYRLRSVVLDCPDPVALSHFYGQLLEADVDDGDPEWCEVRLGETGMKLAFQHAPDHVPPDWPDGQPQQVHLDITTADLAAASVRAVELGARVLDGPVDEESSVFQVHADPAGHPFCFVEDRPLS